MRDRVVTAAIALGTSALFLTTVSSRPALEDSVESITGVRALGILHAPGYPSYVVAARLFATIEPFGSWAFRVNLFSLVCTAAAAALVYRGTRRLGATIGGAVAGSATLATALSIWFYAGYAKAYSFTLLLIAAAVVLVLRWRQTGATRDLIGTVVVVAIAGGAAFQTVLLMVPATLWGIATGIRRPTLREAALALTSGVVALTAVLGFVVVRARMEPAVNWGGATNASRLSDLVTMHDFGFGERVSSTNTDTSVAPTHSLTNRVTKLRSTGTLLGRELNAVLLAVAAIGLVVMGSRSRQRSTAVFVLLLVATDVIGVVILVGVNTARGADSAIRIGGFLLAATFGLALLVGVGTSAISAAAAASRDRVTRTLCRVGVGIVAAGLVAATFTHLQPAQHRSTDFADHYAADVFATVPRNSLLLVRSAEWAFPLRYEQVVRRRRTDVDVVVLNLLGRPWYREQVRRMTRQHVAEGTGLDVGTDLATTSLGRRPVWLDIGASVELRHRLGFRQRGIAVEVQRQPGISTAPIDEQLDLVDHRYHVSGLFDDPARTRYPNAAMLLPYVIARVQLAGQLFEAGQRDAAVAQLRLALKIDPTNELARINLEKMTSNSP